MDSDWRKYNLMPDDWDNLIRIKFQENSVGGAVFCDVGAHKGIITSHFINLAGPSGKVYAFEMNPYSHQVISYLSSNNCIIENMAVSNTNGTIDYYGDFDEASANILGYDTNYKKMNKKGEIKSITLDEYFKDKIVNYIKIDVEGAELSVVKGGMETLRKCKYAVIECHFNEDWKELCEFLISNEFSFRNLVDDVPIFYGECIPTSGLSSNGRPYQIYLKND